MRGRTVGIIGGMGPMATVDLMARVVRAIPARDDAEHIRMLVDNNPHIPSRAAALAAGGGESPAPVLIGMAQRLEACGAELLAIPCNTAHFWHAAIQAAVRIPLLDMIALASAAVVRDNPGIRRVGILAAPAVLRTGLYADALGRLGVAVCRPSPELQERLTAAIGAVKAGVCGPKESEALAAAAGRLAADGAEALVVACTELSLVVPPEGGRLPVTDAAQVLAEEIVRAALPPPTAPTAPPWP